MHAWNEKKDYPSGGAMLLLELDISFDSSAELSVNIY